MKDNPEYIPFGHVGGIGYIVRFVATTTTNRSHLQTQIGGGCITVGGGVGWVMFDRLVPDMPPVAAAVVLLVCLAVVGFGIWLVIAPHRPLAQRKMIGTWIMLFGAGVFLLGAAIRFWPTDTEAPPEPQFQATALPQELQNDMAAPTPDFGEVPTTIITAPSQSPRLKPAAQSNVTVAGNNNAPMAIGDRSVAVVGDVNAPVITGDNNTVNAGPRPVVLSEANKQGLLAILAREKPVTITVVDGAGSRADETAQAIREFLKSEGFRLEKYGTSYFDPMPDGVVVKTDGAENYIAVGRQPQ